MGGHPPIGYDCHDRKLHINEAEAKTVRHIYARYVELRGVRELQVELERDGYRTKERTSTTGHEFGGIPFSRGHLYKLLSNRIYIGEAVHKGTAYPGEHDAIIDQKLWDDVQLILSGNRHAHRTDQNVESPALLKGLLYDDAGNHMSPTRSGKNAKRYRYYVSQAILQHQDAKAGSLPRLPAHDLERLVTNAVLKALSDEPKTRQAAARFAELNENEQNEFLRGIVQRVEVSNGKATVIINSEKILAAASDGSASNSQHPINLTHIELSIEIIEKRGAVRIIAKNESEPIIEGDNSALIKAIARGYYWREQLINGDVKSVEEIGQKAGVSDRYVSHILRYGFCNPKIAERILEGLERAPFSRNLRTLSLSERQSVDI
jgi:hypothetical protein